MGAYGLALLAGVISFSSPCCLPLMPGYVSYVSGTAGGVVNEGVALRSRMLATGGLFVLGFALVFTAMGASISGVGSLLLRHRAGLTQVAGLLVILFGLVNLGLLRIPFLYRERRFDMRRIAPGPAGALPLGIAFALGWTPCIGPVLGGILAIAASSTSPVYGASLLFTYALGLGLPFFLLAAGLAREGRVMDWLRRHGRVIEAVGGAVLVLMGVLMITGTWVRLFAPILRFFSRSGMAAALTRRVEAGRAREDSSPRRRETSSPLVHPAARRRCYVPPEPTQEEPMELGSAGDRLKAEFAGVFSPETVEEVLRDSALRWKEAPIQAHVPVLAERFAKERLKAVAQVGGQIVKEVPEVLFVCVHNAGRSQMAAALLDHHAAGRVHVRSAGSTPADDINPAVAAAMDEIGLDLSKEFPKPLTTEVVEAADVVVTMGCGDACPVFPGKRYLDWELPDPSDKPVNEVRVIRDEIDGRVRTLLSELVPA